MKQYLIQPPSVSLEEISYWKEFKTYSEYNYLRPGIASQIKRRHFEICLKLMSRWFHKANVIDFGCADGYFLPSLANYFDRVVAIDKNPDFIRVATEVVSKWVLIM
ncbi:MAG: class I SAM-dependent methyltransferase [Euryarchaeota archaeon]|nr:class I SAM-dependent methyltransferase [Euryarchaeota archaeon]